MENIIGSIEKIEPKSKSVSYSQYSTWKSCPHKWKLTYIDNLGEYDSSLNTVFGDAIHEAFQTYVDVLYNKSASEADSLDLIKLFNDSMYNALKEIKLDEKENVNAKKLVYTKEDLFGFLQDGKDILDWFSIPKNRIRFFPSKVYEVLGIEMEINTPIRDGIRYKGYLDLVLHNKIDKSIRILDFKTASFGWNKYQKADTTKINQLLLYKKFLSEKLNVPLTNISVEYIILKRKLMEGYSQERGEKFIPSNGKVSVNEAYKNFECFLDECFNSDGTHNKKHHYKKTPGKNRKSCKYCIFAGSKHCDQKEDKE